MKAVLASYQTEGWGDLFVIAILIGAVVYTQLNDMGYLVLMRDSFRVLRSHRRIKRKTQKELRRQLRLEYVREKDRLYKRQVRRTKQRLYMLWRPYVEQQEAPVIADSRKESA